MRQSGWSILSRDFTSESRSNSTMNVANRKRCRYRFAFVERRAAEIEQTFSVERVFDLVMLPRLTVTPKTRRDRRLEKYVRKIEMTGFPVVAPDELQTFR